MVGLVVKRSTIIEKRKHGLSKKMKGYARAILGPRRDKRKKI